MQLTPQEKVFLNMIKDPCITACLQCNILPSLMGVLAISISSWGSSEDYNITRNIYKLPADDEWYGKCYSKSSGSIYEKKSECKEIAPILYRVYDHYGDSIRDFITYISTTRRSVNGPLKYQSLFKCTTYKKALNKLVRAGFLSDYLSINEDVVYTTTLLTLIEKYELYNWDDTLKYKLKQERLNMYNEIMSKGIDFSVEHMYRVRLDWERPDTQIFASPVFNDAREEALAHEGYKIYIDDDGELAEDPWIKTTYVEEVVSDISSVVIPIRGRIVQLCNCPVYRTSIDNDPFAYYTGTYYYYDSLVTNKRARITTYKNLTESDPTKILGYINI